MPTMTRNLLISIGLALAAGVALVLYTAGVKSEAASTTATTRVAVATADITTGTTVEQAIADHELSYRAVRRADVVGGAVTDLATVRGEVFTQPLFDGEQLTASRVGSTQAQAAAFRVTGNQRLMRVPLSVDAALYRDVRGGDHVDVMASYNEDGHIVTSLIVPNALVVENDPSQPVSDGSDEQPAGASMLLSVSEQQTLLIANALANAGGDGGSTIWLALVGKHDPTFKPIAPVAQPGFSIKHHGVPQN